MSCRFMFATALALSVCASAFAQKRTWSQPCGDYDTQSEMNLCAHDEAADADAKLNETYSQLIAKLKGDAFARSKVVASERAWLAYRGADLAAAWPIRPGESPTVAYGSVHPLCYYKALTAMTNDRTSELQRWMTSQEGDICSSQLARCRRAAETTASGN